MITSRTLFFAGTLSFLVGVHCKESPRDAAPATPPSVTKAPAPSEQTKPPETKPPQAAPAPNPSVQPEAKAAAPLLSMGHMEKSKQLCTEIPGCVPSELKLFPIQMPTSAGFVALSGESAYFFDNNWKQTSSMSMHEEKKGPAAFLSASSDGNLFLFERTDPGATDTEYWVYAKDQQKKHMLLKKNKNTDPVEFVWLSPDKAFLRYNLMIGAGGTELPDVTKLFTFSKGSTPTEGNAAPFSESMADRLMVSQNFERVAGVINDHKKKQFFVKAWQTKDKKEIASVPFSDEMPQILGFSQDMQAVFLKGERHNGNIVMPGVFRIDLNKKSVEFEPMGEKTTLCKPTDACWGSLMQQQMHMKQGPASKTEPKAMTEIMGTWSPAPGMWWVWSTDGTLQSFTF